MRSIIMFLGVEFLLCMGHAFTGPAIAMAGVLFLFAVFLDIREIGKDK